MEREAQQWDKLVDAIEPDERRREALRDALDRYRIARGLLNAGADGEGPVEPISPVAPAPPIDSDRGRA